MREAPAGAAPGRQGPLLARLLRQRLAHCAAASALQASLRAALPVTRQQVYGQGDCASNPQSSCFDRNRWIVASAIDIDAFPFQNRPTFQQTVELTRSAGR